MFLNSLADSAATYRRRPSAGNFLPHLYSHLVLADDPLAVSDISRLHLAEAEFAYLPRAERSRAARDCQTRR
jgi:hypothetical protein